MKPLPAELRTQNYSTAAHCGYCLNVGLVITGRYRSPAPEHPLHDGYGPCPFCERGFRLEFGLGRTTDGRELQADNPPWGKDGFWQGEVESAPLPVQDDRPLSRQENLLRLKLLNLRAAGRRADPLLSLDEGTAAERLLKLQAACQDASKGR